MTEAERAAEVVRLIQAQPETAEQWIDLVRRRRPLYDWAMSPVGRAIKLAKGTVAPPGARFPFRGITVVDAEFAAAKAALATMDCNLIECQIFSGTTNLLTRLNQLTAGQYGWNMLGHWTPSTAGGTHSISDANVATIVDGIANHARNSHYYYLADEPNISTYTTLQQNACRDVLRARRNLIRQHDPLAKCCFADFRKAQLSPLSTGSGGSGRTYGLWGGTDDPNADVYTDRVADEIWLSYYPRPTATVENTMIATIAGYCDAAGIPYSQFLSAHNYLDTLPSYPTQANFQDSVTQTAATNAINVILYIWADDWDTSDTSSPNLHLRDNPAGKLTQAQVGTVFVAYD